MFKINSKNFLTQ